MRQRYRSPALAHPNILYLHSHDTGRYVQPYGYAVPTPRIQGLAEQGMLFRQAFCAASDLLRQPRLPADRAVRPHQRHAGAGPPRLVAARLHATTSSTRCARSGYHSALIGEQHISKRPDVIGYDRVVKISTPRASTTSRR